ncbi:hypothetical protein EMEDMD4_600051 [Sinorhizobium medicae]|uniref:Uncharacterized protein n=1 Tax=Sinorhizobium medicae TaxID=110321 RepID=A0A508X9D2_9HYPH|nr:hypothetical protein EMEDMD4_600051 [Sinorhizobium medicae]
MQQSIPDVTSVSLRPHIEFRRCRGGRSLTPVAAANAARQTAGAALSESIIDKFAFSADRSTCWPIDAAAIFLSPHQFLWFAFSG